MSDELTVTDALQELRDMFPGERFRVSIQQDAQIDENGEVKWRESFASILQPTRGLNGFYDSPTLEESLEKVRAFKQSQEQER